MQPQILVNFGLGGRTMILADKIIEERKRMDGHKKIWHKN